MAPRKYTRQTVGPYYDPELKTNGVLVTAWTEDAWNRAQEARRRYLADLEWQRAHPFLAGIRNFGGDVLDGIGNFVNDELLLNKNNIRVRNALAHPEVMNELQKAGNFTGAVVAAPFAAIAAAETAPAWAPWVLRGAKALATPKGMLAADAAGTMGMTYQQWAPWLFGTTGAVATIPAGQYIAENGIPSISLPNFRSRTMLAEAAPTDSVGTAPANPSAAPADTTGSYVRPAPSAQPALPTTAPGTGTASPAPASPEGGNNGNGDDKKWYQKLWETSGKGSTSKWGPKAGRFVRNWGIRVPAYTAVGAPVVDVLGNIVGAGLEPDSVQHNWQWNATRARFMPERTILRGIGKSYMTTPTITTSPLSATTLPATLPATTPVDSNYIAPQQIIAPTDTLDF